MKTENNNNDILIIGGIAVVAVGVGLYMYNKKKTSGVPVESDSEDVPAPTPSTGGTPATPSTPAAKLNYDLVLKKGMYNYPEVGVLQKWLGVTADNKFGNDTEAKLFAKKGVKQMSLNQYTAKADINTKPLAIGNKVMANKNNVVVTLNKMLGDGKTYYNTGEKEDTYAFGDVIGTIVAITADKNSYIVKDQDLFQNLVWVLASNVSKV